MEFLDEMWNAVNRLSLPSLEEAEAVNQAAITENPILFPAGRITERYLELQALYRYLFSMYLTAQSGISRLDSRLKERGYLKAGESNMDFYQKYDLMGLDYLYLRSFVHIERLTPEQIDLLERLARKQGGEQTLKDAVQMMEQTYKQVLAVNSENPKQQFEIFPSVYGEGIVKGEAILIGLKSMADYDGAGMIKDEDEDQRRVNTFYSVSKQLETILSKMLKTEVVVITEI